MINILACPELLGPIVAFIKNGVLPMLKSIVPILLILFGMLDFGKAVIASNDGKSDELNESKKRFIRRVAAAVVIFLMVTIVEFVMNLLAENTNGAAADANNWAECWNNGGSVNNRSDTGRSTETTIDNCVNELRGVCTSTSGSNCICKY